MKNSLLFAVFCIVGLANVKAQPGIVFTTGCHHNCAPRIPVPGSVSINTDYYGANNYNYANTGVGIITSGYYTTQGPSNQPMVVFTPFQGGGIQQPLYNNQSQFRGNQPYYGNTGVVNGNNYGANYYGQQGGGCHHHRCNQQYNCR